MKKILCALLISLLTCNALAGDFEDGFHAVEKGDYKKALPLLKSAAKQGNAMAQVLHGFMYKNGKGLKQNSKEAVNSFRLAAEQGDANGQLLLGLANWSGRGVAQDPVRAYTWIYIAAANGSHEALKERDMIAKKMTPKQIEQAQELARKCTTNKYKGCD